MFIILDITYSYSYSIKNYSYLSSFLFCSSVLLATMHEQNINKVIKKRDNISKINRSISNIFTSPINILCYYSFIMRFFIIKLSFTIIKDISDPLVSTRTSINDPCRPFINN